MNGLGVDAIQLCERLDYEDSDEEIIEIETEETPNKKGKGNTNTKSKTNVNIKFLKYNH